ncbi:MAG: Spy/CpxP family protein refolding chaperone [Bryobacteraceae bacterium]
MKYSIMTMIAAALACTLSAQWPAPGRPGQGALPTTADVQSYLALTDAQVQSLHQLRLDERQAVSPLMQQMMQKQQNLNTQEAAGASAAAVGQLVLDLQAIRTSISTTASNYRTQAVNLLTADQRTKLQALEAAAALRPAIAEASGLGLLTQSQPGPAGGGPGPNWRHGGRRGSFGPGPGAPPPPQN